MITLQKSVRNTACEFCPIKGTEYCHKINPMAPRYTRSEKIALMRETRADNKTEMEG